VHNADSPQFHPQLDWSTRGKEFAEVLAQCAALTYHNLRGNEIDFE
jgi:hypothetical protein